MAKKGFSNFLSGMNRPRRRPRAGSYEINREPNSNQESSQNGLEKEGLPETPVPENELIIGQSDTIDDTESNEEESLTRSLLKLGKGKLILVLIAMFFVMLIFISIITAIVTKFIRRNDNELSYYTSKCQEVTVVFVDKNNNYAPTGTQTYPLEEYVAGVISAEVGMFSSAPELLKAFAVAARSFVITASDDNCTIEASARKQAFKDLSDNANAEIFRSAANETTGEVLLKGGEVFQAQYDAFAVASVDSNYYTLKQASQKIPVSWVESHISKASLNFYANANHGRGMSQWGSYYLATEKGYTYKDIINFYYQGEDIQFGVRSAATTSIANLDIKTTTNAKNTLNQPLTEFLAANNDSLENYNNFIKSSVDSVGVGTRDGVITAAVSLINYLYDNYNTKLPYYWGGSHQMYGLPSSIGTYEASIAKNNGTHDYYVSFDCSGFVSWAIKNGGYEFNNRLTTVGFDDKFSKDSCAITESNCIGEPGDLVNSRSGHVQLIISVDENRGKYIIAESSNGVVINEINMHSNPRAGTNTKILHMSTFYNNPENVDPNY